MERNNYGFIASRQDSIDRRRRKFVNSGVTTDLVKFFPDVMRC